MRIWNLKSVPLYRRSIGVFRFGGVLGMEPHIVYGGMGGQCARPVGGRSFRAGRSVNKFNTFKAWCAQMPANALPDQPISVPLMFYA